MDVSQPLVPIVNAASVPSRLFQAARYICLWCVLQFEPYCVTWESCKPFQIPPYRRRPHQISHQPTWVHFMEEGHAYILASLTQSSMYGEGLLRLS